MANIEKKAGKFIVDAWTDGQWQWWHIRFRDHPRDEPTEINGLKVDDLKDLHYCLTEVIAKLQRLEEEVR